MSAGPQSDNLNNAKIRIITNSDIRYEGILYKINPEEKTITLKNVQSFGTEDRRTDKVQAGSSLLYEYIVFRSIEIKDLIVLKDENQPPEGGADAKAPEPKSEQKPETSKPTDAPPAKPSGQTAPAERAPRHEDRAPRAEDGGQNDYDNQQQRRPRQEPRRQNQGVDFQFQKMVDSLKDFEKMKNEVSTKYESKYANDDFFDTISSSIGSERRREIESYNDRRIDKDTFGDVPRIHFSSNYNHGGNRYGGNNNSGGYRNYRAPPRNDQPPRDAPQGRFRRQGNDGRRGPRQEEDFEYVRKEN